MISLCQDIDYCTVLNEDVQLAYYALKNKKADCNGYAQSFVMLSHFSGFTCSYIDGSATDDHGFPMGRHAWNIACADGKYFWLDVTWDDMGTSEPSVKWYGLDGATMSKTHFPDREYQPILDLKTVLPDKVTFTMHLDVNNQNGFNRGITQESGKKVQLKNLSAGEYYTPALVIWNDGYTPVKVDISYNLDGRFYRWSQAEVKANSNVVFRTNASQLKNKTGSHRIVWYCDGIPLGFFEWQVE